MKRPLFLFAILLSISILVLHFFVKDVPYHPDHITHLISQNPHRLAIKGIVISDPVFRYSFLGKKQTFVVSPELMRISDKWFYTRGNIQVTSYRDKELKYGDEILFEAKVRAPSSNGERTFDYKKYLERKGIFAIATVSKSNPIILMGKGKGLLLKSYAYRFKRSLEHKIVDLFMLPEGHFLSAVLLGERQDMPEGWKGIFMKTQTMHLLAISGLHVGIIAFIALFLVGLFGIPRTSKFNITILILVAYAIMIGGRPSVVRATIMGVVLLASYALKRDADIYNSLGLAASAILIFNPGQLFNRGFILSFISVLSIVYIAPKINHMFGIDKIDRNDDGKRVRYYIFTLSTASLAVWLGLLPLTVNFFNIISPISVVVNIIAIPLLFIIIALSISALIFQLFFLFLGFIFAESADFFIAILLSSLRFFSKLPFAYFEVASMNLFAVTFYYLLLIIICEKNRLECIWGEIY